MAHGFYQYSLITFSALTLSIFSISCTSAPKIQNILPTSAQVTATILSPPKSTPIPADEAFVNEVYHRLNVDDTIPEAGRQATISLFIGKPTLLFPENQGPVLVYEVPQTPLSQEETTQATIMLIGTAVGVTADQHIQLDGAEVIFYHSTQPIIGFKGKPPWGAQDILAAPLADELMETFKQKGAATVTPTPKPIDPLSTS